MVSGWWSDVAMGRAMTEGGGTSSRAEAQGLGQRCDVGKGLWGAGMKSEAKINKKRRWMGAKSDKIHKCAINKVKNKKAQ